jgi:16S rRNA (guanine966-N2)-methyltransferase
VFVDADAAAGATIGDNLRSLGWSGPAYRVVRSDVGRWVAGAGTPDLARADVVLADPPYSFEGWDDLLGAIAGSGFAGVAVLETGREIEAGPGWNLLRSRRYRTSVVQLVRPAVLAGLPVEPKGGR